MHSLHMYFATDFVFFLSVAACCFRLVIFSNGFAQLRQCQTIASIFQLLQWLLPSTFCIVDAVWRSAIRHAPCCNDECRHMKAIRTHLRIPASTSNRIGWRISVFQQAQDLFMPKIAIARCRCCWCCDNSIGNYVSVRVFCNQMIASHNKQSFSIGIAIPFFFFLLLPHDLGTDIKIRVAQ